MKSDVPKVLHRVCGEPIIQYVLNIAKAVGSLKNYIVLGHQMDAVSEILPDGCMIVEQKKLLGTADAVQCAQKYFKNYRVDVLILCGDTPLLKKEIVQKLIQKHRRSQAACTFLTAVVHHPEGYGRVIRDEKKQVGAIREDKDLEGYERDIAEINVGVYCFRSQELFQGLKNIQINPKKKEFYLTNIIELFFEKNLKIDTIETEHPSDGFGVNTREDLAVAEAILRERILKNLMAEGVTIIDPKTTYIDAGVKIGQDTVIRPFTVIEKNVQIGSRCTIGPFARIRPGTRIANHVEVGNFTEVSRTKLGEQTLMKHFGFLGDAEVGSSVNIGAGVVTANFDGQQKNVTKILDRAFIGSDSILVAPVKIGKRAVTGAGSVVTKGQVVADKSVVAGVPARVIEKRKLK